MTDADLAAHLAEVAGRLLLEVRGAGVFSAKALGKAGDQTANQFLVHAIRDQRPADGLLSEEEKDNLERLTHSRVCSWGPAGVSMRWPGRSPPRRWSIDWSARLAIPGWRRLGSAGR